MTINESMSKREHQQTASIRPSHLSVRRQRIERWAYKGRSSSTSHKVMRSSSSLGTSLIQQRAESSFIQAERHLNMDLYQLGEEREKLLERQNFDQKLFANKQALRHKDNSEIQRTVDYVRKCCKYSNMDNSEGEFVDSTMIFDENHSTKINRSRSFATTTTPAIKENLSDDTRREKSNEERFLDDDDSQKRHVQFRLNSKRGSQSAHVSRKSRPLVAESKGESAHRVRTINSAPPRTPIYQRKEPRKSKRPSPRIYSSKNSLHEFRRHPERFLSQSNRYLPLLRRQATEIESQEFHSKKQCKQSVSRFSDGSEFTFDDVKSFLSEENETGKPAVQNHIPIWDSYDRRNINKPPAPNKMDVAEITVDNTTEYLATLSRLRDREYANLQRLIRSNSIEHILEPLSSKKTSENKQQQSMDFDQILDSIDSLRCSKETNREKQQQIDMKKNLSKLGILIF